MHYSQSLSELCSIFPNSNYHQKFDFDPNQVSNKLETFIIWYKNINVKQAGHINKRDMERNYHSNYLRQLSYLLMDKTRIIPNITAERIKGVFHSGNCLTGMSSIFRAALKDPLSTGLYPIFLIRLLTIVLASSLSPA